MKKWKLFLPVLMLLTCGCEIPDEDRCLDGKVLDKQMGVCVEYTATAETDTGTDTGRDMDSNAPDTGTDTARVGVADVPCYSDADCADNGQVDYCLPDWQNPSGPGTCLQDDCTSGSCEVANHTCCDCPQFGWPSPLCSANELLEGSFGFITMGCTCN